MEFIESYIKLLFPDSIIAASKENAQEFSARFLARSYSHKDPKYLEEHLTFMQIRDSLHISVTFGDSDPISIISTNPDFISFVDGLDQEATYLDEDEISIDITISKTISDFECTIYDIQTFINTIKAYDANQFFIAFSRLITTNQGIKFKVLNLHASFYTTTISFSPISEVFRNIGCHRRNEIFENFISQCHFTSLDVFKVIPDDFLFISEDIYNVEIKNLFKRYANLLSIIYLFDITSIKENQIVYKINGYKAIKGISDLNIIALNDTYDEYFKIYNWVYNGGNLNDKIGLARNIISLHFANNGELELQGQPFHSVKSSFRVYEKQNIKQYIDVRNKISDQLLDFNIRANKIIESFAVGFQRSSLALISFYISAIVLKVMSKGEFVNLFSFDVTVLSIVFLIISYIYYCVSRWEIKEQRKRFADSYYNLKERYSDLLEENDIKRILNNDKEFNEDIKFIDNKRITYSWMWLLFLGLLSVSTVFLFLRYNLN